MCAKTASFRRTAYACGAPPGEASEASAGLPPKEEIDAFSEDFYTVGDIVKHNYAAFHEEEKSEPSSSCRSKAGF